MEAGPPQVAKREEAPYELPSRQRARTIAKILLTAFVALLVAGLGAGAWKAQRRDRQRKAMAAEWGMDEATFERVSAAMERGMLGDRDVAFERYVERHLEEKRARGEKVDRARDEELLRQSATVRGIPRLTDQDLTEYHALLKRQIFVSERRCPCSWDKSTCSIADLMDGLRRLSDAEVTRWAFLSSRAAILEVQAMGPLPSSAADLQEGLEKIVEGLDEQSRERVLRTFGDPRGVPKAEQCFTIRALFTGSESLDEAAYLRFIRASHAASAP